MAFFDPQPPGRTPDDETLGPEHGPWESWYSIPPAVISTQLVLAQTDDAAVVISDLHVYDTGFLIHLHAVTRLPMSRRRFRAMYDWAGEETVADEMLRFGVQFADGGIATNLDHDRQTSGVELRPGGGTGGPTRIDDAYTVRPLPPAGPLRMVCQWPTFEIDETSHEIDGTLIRDAARNARQLWPEGSAR